MRTPCWENNVKFVCAWQQLVGAALTGKPRFLPQLHESNWHEFSYALRYKFCMWSDNCGLEHELKFRFCFICKAALKISWNSNCNCEKCLNDMKELSRIQLIWNSPKPCKCFEVWISFLRECMNDWQEVEDDWVWMIFLLTSIITSITKSKKWRWKVLMGFEMLKYTQNVDKMRNILKFQSSF